MTIKGILAPNEVQKRVLDWLENYLVGVFYLTGSRFFGNSNIDSDYDFFTGFIHSVERDLLQFGFINITNDPANQYKDSLVVKILRHEKGKVDIQLVKDERLKMIAQVYIKRNLHQYLLDATDMANRRGIWNNAIHACQEVMRCVEHAEEKMQPYVEEEDSSPW